MARLVISDLQAATQHEAAKAGEQHPNHEPHIISLRALVATKEGVFLYPVNKCFVGLMLISYRQLHSWC